MRTYLIFKWKSQGLWYKLNRRAILNLISSLFILICPLANTCCQSLQFILRFRHNFPQRDTWIKKKKKKPRLSHSAGVKKYWMHLHSFLPGQIQILLQPQVKQALRMQMAAHVMHIQSLVCVQPQSPPLREWLFRYCFQAVISRVISSSYYLPYFSKIYFHFIVMYFIIVTAKVNSSTVAIIVAMYRWLK